jgi:uncharacterized protein YacL
MKKLNTIESLILFSGHYAWKKDFRLSLWLLLAGASYGAGGVWLRNTPEAGLYLRLAVAIFPLIPVLLYIRSWVQFMRGLDELQRRLQLEVWLFAALGTVLTGVVISVLGAQGVPLGPLAGGLGVGGAFFVMLGLWTAGSVVAIRRYR